jgi:ureidoglycolate hydrolase
LSDLLEIMEHHGNGYQPLVDFGSWRVAILRSEEGSQPLEIKFMERHTHTDEIFVLLAGKATLIVGEMGGNEDVVLPQVMEMGKLYNVKQNAWHTCLLSPDASLLIVENSDTGGENTEYYEIKDESRKRIIEYVLT